MTTARTPTADAAMRVVAEVGEHVNGEYLVIEGRVRIFYPERPRQPGELPKPLIDRFPVWASSIWLCPHMAELDIAPLSRLLRVPFEARVARARQRMTRRAQRAKARLERTYAALNAATEVA